MGQRSNFNFGLQNYKQLFVELLLCNVHYTYPPVQISPFKDEAQTALFKDPVRTAQ